MGDAADYGLTDEQAAALDGAVPGWRDLPPDATERIAAAHLEETRALIDSLLGLEQTTLELRGLLGA